MLRQVSWHAMEGHFSSVQKLEDQLRHMRSLSKLQKIRSGISNEGEGNAMPSRAFRFLHHPVFELTFGAIIVLNLVLVIIETDAVANEEAVPAWVEIASWAILISFIVEISLRLWTLGQHFFVDGVNLMDLILVVVDASINFLSLFAGQLFPVSFLRIVRLCKIARIAKALHIFPELRILVAGIIGSARAIFWGTLLLSLCLLVWAIIAVQFIHPLNTDIAEQGHHGDCIRCARAYASVFDATLTFCQQIVAGDSWGTVNVTVIEHYPATAIFYSGVFLSVGMAVLNLILGVVVDVASQARSKMLTALDDEKLMRRMECHSHLLELCAEMDKDNNGDISRTELEAAYEGQNEKLVEALRYMDVSAEDIDILWTVLDEDKSGTVSYSEFVSNCYKLKTSDTQFMLAYIKYYITVMKDKICNELCREERLIAQQFHQSNEEMHNICRDSKEGIQELEGNILFESQTVDKKKGGSKESADSILDEVVAASGQLAASSSSDAPFLMKYGAEGRNALYLDILHKTNQQIADLMASTQDIIKKLEQDLPDSVVVL